MKGEINRNWYCAVSGASDCPEREDCSGCSDAHRKWPTLEQFREEYGEEVSQGMPVWVNLDIAGLNTSDWILTKLATEFLSADRKVYYGLTQIRKVNAIVCACTPWGKPPNGWRPN